MELPKKALTIKQIFQAVAVFGAVAIGAVMIILPQVLNQKKNLSMTKPRALETAVTCDVQITIPTPTPTQGPPTIMPPTVTKTPTPIPTVVATTNTPTPTPVVPCSENPTDIILALDRSTSLSKSSTVNGVTKTQLEWEKIAVNNIITNVLAVQPDSVKNNLRVGVVSWAQVYDNVKTAPLQSYGTDAWQTAINFVSSMSFADNGGKNGTCIECGVDKSALLFDNPSKRKFVILMSDGIANNVISGAYMTDRYAVNDAGDPYSPTAAKASISKAAEKKAQSVTYFVVGYGRKDKPNYILEDNLKAIAGNATVSGGDFYRYGGEPQDWNKVLSDIIPNICSDNTVKTSAVDAAKILAE